MKTVILVPRRAHPERDKLWAWAKARWERHFPEFPVIEGHHDEGPFNRSAAINRAARLAGDWDHAIIIDGDIFIRRSQVLAALERSQETGRVTWAHLRWRGIRRDWTERIIRDGRDFGPEIEGDMDVLTEQTNPISWSCCIVFPRGTFDDMGGFDERFRGWGFEDMAVQSIVAGLYGHERIRLRDDLPAKYSHLARPADVFHLWHDRSTPGDGRAAKARGEYTAEAVTNARLGRRYMVALRRDHALHDRPDMPTSEEERQRDIGNLVHDDAKLTPVAAKLGLPDWSEWWPTLEELRDSWKAIAKDGPDVSVTLVVTSGGSADRWPERRAYLERSLASLADQVTGNIVQRVVYADWPSAEIVDELREISARHGFYVAGEGHHGHTGMRSRLWTYLRKHAKGQYVFGTEDDFAYDRPVDLSALATILEADSHLAQVALLRDACYQDERDTGGILGWPEPAFTRIGVNGTSRLEHRLFWTNNPSLFRRSLTARSWPPTREDPATGKGPGSEVLFGRELLADERIRFAFWGDGQPWVRHLGEVRAGTGY